MIKRTVSDWFFDIFNYIILGILLVITLYPFWYIFIYSISDPVEASKRAVMLVPMKISFANYMLLFNTNNILNAAFISTVRTVVGTAATTFAGAMFAYVVTKDLLPFRKTIYRLIILSMYISPGFIPFYILIKDLHLRNNFLVYILPGVISAFYIILIKTYIESLPAAVEESALVDGAGYMTIFLKIIIPLCTPVLASVSIFTAVGQWSSWMDNMFFCPSVKLETLQYLLYKYLSSQEASLAVIKQQLSAHTMSASTVTPASLRMTITMIVTLPIIIVYPALQRYFIKGILLGAVKG
jgi:ABC-type glycerol-3-phosphate transport system permease component